MCVQFFLNNWQVLLCILKSMNKDVIILLMQAVCDIFNIDEIDYIINDLRVGQN